MHENEDYPWMNLKYCVPILSYKWKHEGEIPSCFIRQFKTELREQWRLIDPAGNSHVVRYNMSDSDPKLTEGWYALRGFYNIQNDCIFSLGYVGECLFHFKVYEYDKEQSNKEEVLYPELHHAVNIPRLDVQYNCVWTHKITLSQATRYKPHVPNRVAQYLIQARLDSWIFIGRSGVEVECRVIIPPNHKKVIIGSGWRNFCKVENVVPFEEFTFRFTSSDVRIVHVN